MQEIHKTKGPSTKVSAVRGGGGLFSAEFWGQEGSSDADIRIFGAKTLNFSKFMVCPHGQGRKEINFSRFFMDDP